MKVDKESLARNRFWITLGGVVLLVLIAAIWLGTGVADELNQLKDETTKDQESFKARAGSALPGKKEFDVLEEKRRLLEEQKTLVWNDGWEIQNATKDARTGAKKEPLISWPKRFQDDLDKLQSPPQFGYAFDPSWVGDYTRADSYAKEYQDLATFFQNKVGPADAETTIDAVLYKSDNTKKEAPWEQVLRHVRNERGIGWKGGTVEEVWLAQEDYWVQRALLQALRQANDTIGRYKEVAGAGKVEAGELFRKRFANPYWQLDLAVVKAPDGFHIKGTIANVGKRRQSLGKDGRIFYWVRLHNDESAKPVALEIQAETLGAGKEATFQTRKPLDVFKDPEGIFAVEQIFETATAPIKRIDQVALGAQSHRTFQPTLLRPRFSPGPASINVTTSGQPARPGETARSADQTDENKLVRYRYSDMTEQVRRMPLGLVLVVDQAHVPEVLAALANSNLRFQITQWNTQFFKGELVPPPTGPVGKPVADASIASNMVELSVYGIASLFERPPVKKPVVRAGS